MYATGRGTVRLLLVVAFVVAVVGVPRQPRSRALKTYRPNKDAAELLDHVMMYEKEWTDVLQEPILLPEEPPYKGRDLGKPPLMPQSDEASSEGPQSNEDSSVTKKMHLYDVHEVVIVVNEYYSAIGSFVDFGAKVVRRALACYTFKRVFYQSKSIYNLMIRNVEPNVLIQLSNSFKKNNVSFIDILSAVSDSDLSIILSSFWKSVKLLQYDGIQQLEKLEYPESLMENMKDLTLKILKFLITNCKPHYIDTEFYLRAGISQNTTIITDSSLEFAMSVEEIIALAQEQSLHMAQTASSLGIVTMPDHLWTSMYYYRGRPRPDSTYLDVDAPPLSEAGHSEAVPTTSVAGPS
ncbi:hypothetical protein QTP88_003766 [Uroleucon formosanum]